MTPQAIAWTGLADKISLPPDEFLVLFKSPLESWSFEHIFLKAEQNLKMIFFPKIITNFEMYHLIYRELFNDLRKFPLFLNFPIWLDIPFLISYAIYVPVFTVATSNYRFMIS